MNETDEELFYPILLIYDGPNRLGPKALQVRLLPTPYVEEQEAVIDDWLYSRLSDDPLTAAEARELLRRYTIDVPANVPIRCGGYSYGHSASEAWNWKHVYETPEESIDLNQVYADLIAVGDWPQVETRIRGLVRHWLRHKLTAKSLKVLSRLSPWDTVLDAIHDQVLDDCTAEALAKLRRSMERYEEQGAFLGWTRRVVEGYAVDLNRFCSAKKRQPGDLKWIYKVLHDPDAVDAKQKKRIRALLKGSDSGELYDYEKRGLVEAIMERIRTYLWAPGDELDRRTWIDEQGRTIVTVRSALDSWPTDDEKLLKVFSDAEQWMETDLVEGRLAMAHRLFVRHPAWPSCTATIEMSFSRISADGKLSGPAPRRTLQDDGRTPSTHLQSILRYTSLFGRVRPQRRAGGRPPKDEQISE